MAYGHEPAPLTVEVIWYEGGLVFDRRKRLKKFYFDFEKDFKTFTLFTKQF